MPTITWYGIRNGRVVRRSQDDDAAPWDLAPVGERTQQLARTERKQFSKASAEHPEGISIGASVRDEQDQMAVWIVAELPSELALERLAVGDPRLGLDAGAPTARIAAPDNCVPGAEVAFDRERNLRTPEQVGMESSAKTVEDGELSPIPDRIATRIDLQHQVVTEYAEPRADVGDPHPLDLAVLEPPELRPRRTRRGGAGAETEARADACVAMFQAESPERFPGTPPAAIAWSLPGGHRRTAWSSALRHRFTCAYPGRFGLRYVTRTNEASPGRELAPRATPASGRDAKRNDARLGADPRAPSPTSVVAWFAGRNGWTQG